MKQVFREGGYFAQEFSFGRPGKSGEDGKIDYLQRPQSSIHLSIHSTRIDDTNTTPLFRFNSYTHQKQNIRNFAKVGIRMQIFELDQSR